MPDYSLAFNQATLTTTYKTAAIITAAAANASGIQVKRGRLFEIDVGQQAVPNATDCPVQWDLSRQTAAGTTTAATPPPLDPADPAFNGLAGINATVEGTITASTSLLNQAINQRSAFRWVAAPGKELVYPATASAGFAVRALSPNYTGAAGGSLFITE